MERLYTIKPKYDWINILKQDMVQSKYGIKGEVAWNTDRNKTIQRISSIDLEKSYGFKKLFEIRK